MAKIADMQIEAKRRRPFRCRVQERRRVRRIERARAKLLAGPDAGGRYQVRKNAGRDDGPANIRNAMPREASKPRFHGVYPLDPASESKVLNDAPRHPERLQIGRAHV